MKLAIALLSIFISISSVHALIQEKPGIQPRKVLILTIPKAGSHLLAKAAELITGKPVRMLPYTDMFKIPYGGYAFDPSDGIVHWQHLFAEFDTLLNQDTSQFIKIVHVRDLRDVIISQMDWMSELGIWARWVPSEFLHGYHRLPQEEKISFALRFPDEYDSVKVFAQRALQWLKDPSVFLSRFEDLVGPSGGGDPKAQRKMILKLADHLGYILDEEDLEYITQHVFGGTITFKKGQIGRWKTYFTEEHINLFEEIMGQELMDLGYEKSSSSDGF